MSSLYEEALAKYSIDVFLKVDSWFNFVVRQIWGEMSCIKINDFNKKHLFVENSIPVKKMNFLPQNVNMKFSLKSIIQ